MIWYSNCKYCGAQLSNNGSGRPRGICSDQCRILARRQKQRRYSAKKPPNSPAYKPVRAPSSLKQREARQKSIVAAVKQQRGKCAYHLQYFGHDLYVSHDIMQVFEFDHVDRAQKHVPSKKRGGGVARMIGRVTDQQLLDEMTKCELVCCNCHRLKTIANGDWKKRAVETKPQLALFDN